MSEACETSIRDLGFDRGHRTLRIIGKGNKPAVIPLVPRTARTIDFAVGERPTGAILLGRDGARLDRRTAHRPVRSIGRRAGIGAVHPHMLRTACRGGSSDRDMHVQVQISLSRGWAWQGDDRR